MHQAQVAGRGGQGGRGRGGRGRDRPGPRCCAGCPTSSSPRCPPAARRTTSSCARSAAAGLRGRGLRSRCDHMELGERLRRDRHRARGQGERCPVLLPHRGRRPPRARPAEPCHAPGDRGRLHPGHHADPRPAGDHGRRRVPRRARRRGLPARGRRPLPDRHLRGRARRATTPTRSSTSATARCGTPGGRPATGARPAATARTRPGIIRVHQFHKVEMFSWCRPEDAAAEHERLLGFEEQMLAKVEMPLPRHRRRGRRPRRTGRAQVRLRGLGADARGATAS